MPVDPIHYSETWGVRSYELDSNGHVNNAVYLSWAEETTVRHAEAAGYGREWARSKGGGWVIRRSDVTYHSPAVYGDVVEVSVRVELVRGEIGRASCRERVWIGEGGGAVIIEMSRVAEV